MTANEDSSPPAVWRHFLALFVVAALVGADLYSKATVMPWLEARMVQYADFHGGYPMPEPQLQRDSHGHQRHPVVGNWLAGMHNLNYGAAFGQGGGLQKILVPGRCVAVLVLGFLILRAPRRRKLYLSALVLVMSPWSRSSRPCNCLAIPASPCGSQLTCATCRAPLVYRPSLSS